MVTGILLPIKFKVDAWLLKISMMYVGFDFPHMVISHR